MNMVLKMYRAILFHAKCITIKHKVMIMKRRKKVKKKVLTDKMSTFSLKEEKQTVWRVLFDEENLKKQTLPGIFK